MWDTFVTGTYSKRVLIELILQREHVCKKEKVRQHAKKVVSDSPGLVDFAIELVFFVLKLPDVQVLFFGEIQITQGLLVILPIKKSLGTS